MNARTEPETYRAEVVLRSLAPHGVSERQRTIIDQVEDFLDTELLEAVDVEVWGREMRADPEVRTAAHERYTAIESWAEGRGCTLAPGFARRRRESIVDDQPEEVISFPLICLVLYAVDEGADEDPVRAVFPCSDGERTYTVMDGIETLSHRTALSDLTPEEPSEAAERRRRPGTVGRP
ncbi:HTH domain-containing protein [Halalkalicoccus sp. NIPERK01]|uniref:HTH domain-containing protein n=1 Tax=Halalkalicoccus sp. NIPERK01 TaxID=3053469 RepID=UPI00256EBA01|nr:HTH domain-containing protein [Halalkalicoccus sp. NIPERK01]MDL5362307.1 hypothetical protein [Halalkalicoccus sp. NIPERK01]